MNLPITSAPTKARIYGQRRLCNDCYLEGVCPQRVAILVGRETVALPEVRLHYQHYLVGLNMQFSAMIDWIIDAIRDFNGIYHDEDGNIVPAPGFASLLTAGAEFWFRDQLQHGKWTVQVVPRMRSEATGRWRLIGTAINIREQALQRCTPIQTQHQRSVK